MTRTHRTCVLAVLCLVTLSPPAFGIYTPNPAGRWKPSRFSLMADFQYNSKDLDSGPDVDAYGFFVRPTFAPIRNMSVYGRFGFQGADKIDVGFAGGFGVQYAYQFPSAPKWAVGGAFDFLYWTADIEHTDSDIPYTITTGTGENGAVIHLDVSLPITGDEVRRMREDFHRDFPDLRLPISVEVELEHDD